MSGNGDTHVSEHGTTFFKKKNAIGSETVRKKREKEEETKAIKAKPGSTIMEMTVLHRTAPH